MPELKLLEIVWLGALLGGFAAGGAGFAFAVVAGAIWLHGLDPIHTAMLVVSCGTVLQIGLIWPARRGIELGRLWPFIAGGLCGIPLGVWLLARTEPGTIKLTLGTFILCYGCYALLAPRLPVIKRGGGAADAAIGFAGGILGGLGGYSGVLPTIWTQLRGWPKDVARGVYQPFILAAHIGTLALIGAVALDRGGAILIAAALPALALGGWFGLRVYGRLDERRFRQMLAVLMVVSGALLMI